ncbi:SRPBCC family protein [Piscinibacter sp. HJYY11]|uniref:SRPBCC family protein n=1 Tax=Piscinibacter sp. HJYY11 TaxID=2801333 RepID=UPI00191F446B|nr:SRPBCC family protein [Piscinibacter sp. HJYY11]MBL0727978.1 SRPBCC family protein [Piscinibacter sp. HJYY11]
MIKILITVAVVLVLAVGALLAVAATKPDTFRFERSITINAGPDKIHPLINDMQRFNTWNPYNKKDPAMKTTYRGPQSGPGAAYDFDGNGEVGKGTISIIEPSGPSTVSMRLDMKAPMEASNLIDFTLRPTGNATQVTWAMHGPTPFIAKVMHTLIDMDKMLGKDFDAGLADLKALAERT